MRLEQGPPENPLGLPDFEGSAVSEVAASINNVGGSLTKSLVSAPEVWTGGESFYAITRLDVTGIDHKPVKGNEGQWRRIHVCRATDTVVCPPELFDQVDEIINNSRDRLIKMNLDSPDPGAFERAMAAMGDGGFPTDDLEG